MCYRFSEDSEEKESSRLFAVGWAHQLCAQGEEVKYRENRRESIRGFAEVGLLTNPGMDWAFRRIGYIRQGGERTEHTTGLNSVVKYYRSLAATRTAKEAMGILKALHGSPGTLKELAKSMDLAEVEKIIAIAAPIMYAQDEKAHMNG